MAGMMPALLAFEALSFRGEFFRFTIRFTKGYAKRIYSFNL